MGLEAVKGAEVKFGLQHPQIAEIFLLIDSSCRYDIPAYFRLIKKCLDYR